MIVISLATLFTWVHVHVKGIVFAALLLHTTSNLSRELFKPLRAAAEGWSNPENINTILLLGVAVLVVLIFGPKHLKRP